MDRYVTVDELQHYHNRSQEILNTQLAAIQTNLAPLYSANTTYALGAAVIHDAQLYKCIAAIETAEPWTEAHWQATTVIELINQSINSAIGGKY